MGLAAPIMPAHQQIPPCGRNDKLLFRYRAHRLSFRTSVTLVRNLLSSAFVPLDATADSSLALARLVGMTNPLKCHGTRISTRVM
jgi:hypothetical protein